MGPRDSNSGLLKCTASTLFIELSPRRVNLTTMGLAVHADADLCAHSKWYMLCAVLLPVCLQEKAISALSQLQKVLESVCKVLYSGLHGK